MAATPLRVLCVTRASNTTKGGMERLSFEFIESLKQQPDLDITVITHTGTRTTAPLFALTAIPRIMRAAREVDIVHLGDPLLSLAGWCVRTWFKKPVIVTVHGLDIVHPNPIYQLYLQSFFTKLSAYWPISHYVANIVTSQWQIPTDKVTTLRPGTNDEFYTPRFTRADLESLLQKHSGQSISNKKVLLTTGRLIKRKGVAWFVREVLPQLPADTVYLVAGTGPDATAISEAIEQAGVADRVILLGRVTHEELQVLYNTVDAFIQPNISIPNDVEGFGLVLVEAALCERPVFAANLEGIPDAINNGHNGTLLPSADAAAWVTALTTFLNNPANHQPTGSQARQYTLNKYLWGNIIEDYVKALLPLVKGSSLSER